MNNQHNIITNIDPDSIDSATYGKVLDKQATALAAELGIELEPVLEVAEEVYCVDGLEEGLDALSALEQHGIYQVHGDQYSGRETVTAEELDNGDGTFRYAGDGACGFRVAGGLRTSVPARHVSAAKVAAKLREKPKSVAQMVRELHREGVKVTVAQRKRFERQVAKDERTTARLQKWLADQAK